MALKPPLHRTTDGASLSYIVKMQGEPTTAAPCWTIFDLAVRKQGCTFFMQAGICPVSRFQRKTR